MQLWRFEPIDLTDQNWGTSTYKGEVIVRAKDLEKAKHLAGKAYGIATSHRAGEMIKINPWIHPGFVETSQV